MKDLKLKDELIQSIQKLNEKIHKETIKIDKQNVNLVIDNLVAEEKYDEFHLNNTEQKDPRYGEGREACFPRGQR